MIIRCIFLFKNIGKKKQCNHSELSDSTLLTFNTLMKYKTIITELYLNSSFHLSLENAFTGNTKLNINNQSKQCKAQ